MPHLTRRLLDRGTARPATDWEVIPYRVGLVRVKRNRVGFGMIYDPVPVHGPCGRAEAVLAALIHRVRYAAHPVSFRAQPVPEDKTFNAETFTWDPLDG